MLTRANRYFFTLFILASDLFIKNVFFFRWRLSKKVFFFVVPKKSENIGEQEVEVKVVEATAVEVKVKAAPRCCSGHTEARFSM